MKTRSELKRDYKNAAPRMGVLLVSNKTNQRFLVRATQNLQGGLNRIRFELTYATSLNRELVSDWKALGPGAFEIEVLDELEPKDVPGWDPESDLEELEAMWRARLIAEGATSY
jgi:hypothetical protein